GRLPVPAQRLLPLWRAHGRRAHSDRSARSGEHPAATCTRLTPVLGARDRPGPSAKRPARSGRALATLLALLLAVLWALAAHARGHSPFPGALLLPHVDPTDVFTRSFLERSASYDRFLDLDALLGEATLLVVLALYARRGHRLVRESAAGRIGTGMMLGMLGFAVVWLAEIPFGLAAVWW